MAASLSITVIDHWTDGKRLHVIGSINVTGSGNYVSNGLVLPLIDNANPIAIKSPSNPEYVSISGFKGYNYNFDYRTNKVSIWAAGTQYSTSSTWPEANVPVYMIFPKFINNSDVQNFWLNH